MGFLPVLSLGPALAAISRRPLPTALVGVLALACGAVLAVYDGLDGSRRGVIALGAIAGVTAAGVIASAGRRRRERELADFKAIADAAQQILLRPVPPVIPPPGRAAPMALCRRMAPRRRRRLAGLDSRGRLQAARLPGQPARRTARLPGPPRRFPPSPRCTPARSPLPPARGGAGG